MLESMVCESAPEATGTLGSANVYRLIPLVTDLIPATLPRVKTDSRPETWTDVIIIGAGPTGLACAIEAQKIGLMVLVIEKGCLVNSIYNYPTNMVFFTT